MVRVRKELSKTGKPYFTFLGPEGCSYLENYLIERIRSGEVLGPDSAVITAAKLGFRTKQHVTSINVGDVIRNAIRNAGFNFRPYVLRAYFSSRLLMAQDERLITRDYRSFFMGHSGDIESRYSVNKGRLTEDMIESMRQSYQRSLKFLETSKRGLTDEETESLEKKLTLKTLKMLGFTDQEAEELAKLDDEELQKKIREKLGMKLLNGNSQKVISIKEIENYINQGWEFVSAIPGYKAIIRFPH